jgi:hypothetical protein
MIRSILNAIKFENINFHLTKLENNPSRSQQTVHKIANSKVFKQGKNFDEFAMFPKMLKSFPVSFQKSFVDYIMDLCNFFEFATHSIHVLSINFSTF